MNFRTWAPLWSMIVDSSLWGEPDWVIKVFITILALKDADHVYRGTAYALAQRSKKTEAEVLEALKILSSPDNRRVEAQEFDGRRIELVPDGWLVLNGEKYKELVQQEMKRARDRRAAKAYRDRKKQRVILVGEEAAEYEEAKGKSYGKRRRVVESAGICAGAGQAIREGLEQAENGGVEVGKIR